LGLCEVRWKDIGDFYSDDVRVIYSGEDQSQRGVALLLDEETAKCVKKIEYHGDRILVVTLHSTPSDIVLIQVYMPTSDYSEE